ncbi:MAG: hypothetical protein N2482_02660 [Patescibacteria group bacterium]|nr:hypothetical protein [Patescibacteria group bacterium]
MEKNNQTISTTISLPKSFIFSLYIITTIFITLFLNHQQIIVGTIVNSLLFFTALNIDKKYHLIVAVFPSIVAVFQGLLFGKLTIFLLYFLPFIWMGNYLLMIIPQKLVDYKILNFIIAPIIKASFLFLIANFYVHFKIVPKMFLQAMGVFQLITALLGAGLYNLINLFVNTNETK